jgi:hypothetical protein
MCQRVTGLVPASIAKRVMELTRVGGVCTPEHQRHLDRLLRDYVEHYNTHRPHRALRQRAPNNGEVVEYRAGRPIRRHSTCHGLINGNHAA